MNPAFIFCVYFFPSYHLENQKHYSFSDFSNSLTDTIKYTDSERTRDIKIYWAWDYETTDHGTSIEANNIQDTIDGRNAGNFGFDMCITGIQVPPTLST